ncbi:hypothetical protein D3C87_1885680 [compost metagenome]
MGLGWNLRTSAAHLSCSCLMKVANCAGVPPTGSAPSFTICVCRPGNAALTSRLMVATTVGGVPLGAKKPNHDPASKPA